MSKLEPFDSGSITGGVVGQQMLRWCLFGDTRILTDKLESTGKSKKIHISKTTCNYLRGDPEIDWTEVICTNKLGSLPSSLGWQHIAWKHNS